MCLVIIIVVHASMLTHRSTSPKCHNSLGPALKRGHHKQCEHALHHIVVVELIVFPHSLLGGRLAILIVRYKHSPERKQKHQQFDMRVCMNEGMKAACLTLASPQTWTQQTT